MALIGNYSVLQKNPGRRFGGTTECTERGVNDKAGSHRNRFTIFAKFNSTPNGYGFEGWIPPVTSGGMSSYKFLDGAISNTAVLANGLGANAALDGSIAVSTASLALIVDLVTAMEAQGLLTTAELAGVVAMTTALEASGNITDASLGAIIDLLSSLLGTGSLAGEETAIAVLEADILPYTTLSPESLASAVWEAATSDHNTVGTTGKKLNDLLIEIEKRLKTSTFIALK